MADKQLRQIVLALTAALLLATPAFAAGYSQSALEAYPGDPPGHTPLSIPPGWSVARVWNETLLDAIRTDRPKPPVHARNLFHLSVAMWDAWAAYDPDALGYLTTEKQTADDVEAARREAISYAAFRLLQYRFPGTGYDVDGELCQPGAAASQIEFVDTMLALGYDPTFASTDGGHPRGHRQPHRPDRHRLR